MADFKEGLDFYSHYIGMTRDSKLHKIRKKYGSTGIDVWLAVLDLIYMDKGYYIAYGDEEQKDSVAWDVLDYVKGRYAPDVTTVEEIIEGLVACGLFSGDLFKLGILSSRRIQKQYYKSTAERKAVSVIPEYWLISIDEMKKISERSLILRQFLNRPIMGQNQPISEDNQPNNGHSKVNESKLNESRVDKPPKAANCSRDDLIKDYGIAAVNEYERRFEEWKAKQGAVNANKYAVISKMLYEDYKLGKTKSNLSKGENSSFDIAEIEELLKGKNKAND